VGPFLPTDLVFPVWGDLHTSLLLNFTLPSLLAPGNLPFWSAQTPTRLIFWTVSEEAAVIASVINQWEWPVNCSFLFRPLPADPLDKPLEVRHYYRSSLAYQAAIAEAREAGHAVMPLTPDLILSSEALHGLAGLLEAELSAVFALGLRLHYETVRPQLLKKKAGNQLVLSGSELVQLLIQHMHAYNRDCFWDAEQFALQPAMSADWLPEGGFCVQAFHLHPLYLHRPLPYRLSELESYFPTLDGLYLQQYARFSTEGLEIVQDRSALVVSFGFDGHPVYEAQRASSLERQRLIHAFSQHYCEPIHRWFYEHALYFQP